MSVPSIPEDLMSQHSIKTFNIPISSAYTPDAVPEGERDARQSGAVAHTIPINIVEPKSVQADNLPLSTWASSLILAGNLYKLDLARHLYSLRDPLPDDDGDDDDGDDGSKTPTASDPTSSSLPSLNSPSADPTAASSSASSASSSSSSPSAPASSPSSSRSPSCTASGPVHPILELGAGTGLVGLTAAMLLQAPYATLSDVAGIVPGVAANIAVNAEALVGSGCVVRAGELDWRSPGAVTYPLASAGSTLPRRLERGATAARLVFAADTVYDEEHPALLERTVAAWLERGPAARFVVCYPLRVAYLDYVRELWERLERLGLAPEYEGREQGTSATNGDDELLCEFVVWKWTADALAREAQEGVATAAAADIPTVKVEDLTEGLGKVALED